MKIGERGGRKLGKLDQLTRSAGVVAAATLASRVLGLLRDMLTFGAFGSGLVNEAFYVAWMFPSLLRRLVGEGALTVAFVPVFTKLREERGEAEARRFVETFWTLMTVVLLFLTALGMIFSREIVILFTNPEYRARFDGQQFELAVTMTRYLFPYLFFIGLTALAMGVLNSYGHFFAPAFHPTLLNATWLVALIVLDRWGGLAALATRTGTPWLATPGLALIIGVLLGGVLQLLLQAPFLYKFGMRFTPRFNFRQSAIGRIFWLMIPTAVAVGIVQINTLISTWFITAFPGGRPQIFLANRITEFPYALISLAVATASLPSLSADVGKKDLASFARTLSYGLRLVYFMMIPASVGLAMVGLPLLNVAFERGEFTAVDTANTAGIVLMSCVGLWAVGGIRVVAQAYYALEDMKTPLYAAVLGMVTCAVSAWGFSQGLGRAGVALAISVAAIVNLGALWVLLSRKLPGYKVAGLSRAVVKTLGACIPMAAYLGLMLRLPMWWGPSGLMTRLLGLGAMLGGGAAIFLIGAKLLGIEELDVFVNAFISRARRRLRPGSTGSDEESRG